MAGTICSARTALAATGPTPPITFAWAAPGTHRPYVDNVGIPLLKGGGKLVAAASGRHYGLGHFGLLDLGDGVQKFSMHYEADMDRSGRSVLAIRPCSGKMAGQSAATNSSQAPTRLSPNAAASRWNWQPISCASAEPVASVVSAVPSRRGSSSASWPAGPGQPPAGPQGQPPAGAGPRVHHLEVSAASCAPQLAPSRRCRSDARSGFSQLASRQH